MKLMNKLILITGGSASGKTHLANIIVDKFNGEAIRISQDVFYKPGGDSTRNYDLPEAFDLKLQRETIDKLIKGQEVELPIYDFTKHDVVGHKKVKPAKYIIFEGLFAFNDYELTKISDFKIFVETPADTRLARRIKRDIIDRGRDVSEVIDRWIKDVQPSYRNYIPNLKTHADVIIPWHKIKERTIKSLIVTIRHLDTDVEELIGI